MLRGQPNAGSDNYSRAQKSNSIPYHNKRITELHLDEPGGIAVLRHPTKIN